jgi:hypothetical protein
MEWLEVDKREAKRYRVVVCVWPGLASFDEEKLKEGPVDGKEYVKAMLASQKWYQDDGADWDAWRKVDKAKMVGRAVVVVERIEV